MDLAVAQQMARQTLNDIYDLVNLDKLKEPIL